MDDDDAPRVPSIGDVIAALQRAAWEHSEIERMRREHDGYDFDYFYHRELDALRDAEAEAEKMLSGYIDARVRAIVAPPPSSAAADER